MYDFRSADISVVEGGDEEALHTKISLTRGPQNTFEYEPDEIIELPPILSTVPRTTHPENTTSQASR